MVTKPTTTPLLFNPIKKVKVNIDELVKVILYEGEIIAGFVDKISSDGEHFWLRTAKEQNSMKQKFSFKIDQIIRLN